MSYGQGGQIYHFYCTILLINMSNSIDAILLRASIPSQNRDFI
jgi:hypothetical protein